MLLTSTVLRVRPHREHDRLYTIYTKERGKLTVLGVGHAKITSKLAGHLGPFVISELSVVPGRVWDKLTAAEALQSLGGFAQSLQAVGSGFYILELVDALTRENQPNELLWELLLHSLAALGSGENPSATVSDFEARVLPTLGEHPPLLEHINRELKSARLFERSAV